MSRHHYQVQPQQVKHPKETSEKKINHDWNEWYKQKANKKLGLAKHGHHGIDDIFKKKDEISKGVEGATGAAKDAVSDSASKVVNQAKEGTKDTVKKSEDSAKDAANSN